MLFIKGERHLANSLEPPKRATQKEKYKKSICACSQIYSSVYSKYANPDGDKKEVFSIDKTMGREVRFQLDYVVDATEERNNVLDKFLLYGPACNDDNDSTACGSPEEFAIGKPVAFYEFQKSLLAVRTSKFPLVTFSGFNDNFISSLESTASPS